MNFAFSLIWFEYELCSHLRKKSIIVLNNSHFLKKSKIEKISRLYKFHAIWFPPYSHDKIKKLWAI